MVHLASSGFFRPGRLGSHFKPYRYFVMGNTVGYEDINNMLLQSLLYAVPYCSTAYVPTLGACAYTLWPLPLHSTTWPAPGHASHPDAQSTHRDPHPPSSRGEPDGCPACLPTALAGRAAPRSIPPPLPAPHASRFFPAFNSTDSHEPEIDTGASAADSRCQEGNRLSAAVRHRFRGSEPGARDGMLDLHFLRTSRRARRRGTWTDEVA